MKKVITKVVSVMLAVVLTLTAAPLSGFVGLDLPEWLDFSIKSSAATSGTCGDNVTWSFDESTGTLTISGTGNMFNYGYDLWGSLNSPWRSLKVKYIVFSDGVTTIGNHAFEDCESLTSVTIPDGVRTIGDSAFDSCTGLTSITIPDSVTSIGWQAFNNCTSLKSVTIGDSVTSIGRGAFYNCTSLTKVIIPDSVITIGDQAFHLCDSLTSVTIGDGVTTIGDYAFEDCVSLENIRIGKNVLSIGSHAFYNTRKYNDKSNWEEGVLYIDDYLIRADKELLPEKYNIKNGTKVIADCSFMQCYLTESITIPESVKTIGKEAFDSCSNLISVKIPDGITTIEYRTFSFCYNLESVIIPNSVSIIDKEAFACCKKLKNLKLPEGLTSIGVGAFVSCISLASIKIPENVATIGKDTFKGCTSLASVQLPKGLTKIEENMFYKCTSLRDIIIPDTVTKIDTSAFYECLSLTNIIIPDGTVTISDSAFYGCARLAHVTIPDSVVSIGVAAFRYCTGLTSISVDSNNLGYSSDEYGVLFNKNKTILIQYPAGNSRTKYVIPNSVLTVGAGSFYYCKNLSQVLFGNSVQTVERSAFVRCELASVEFPSSITRIGEHTFYSNSLKSVIIPNSVKSIGEYAFYYSPNIKDVYYGGTEEQWKKISIGSNNGPLYNATIHFSDGTKLSNNKISSSKNNIVISTKRFDNTLGNVVDLSLLGVKCTIGSKVTENNIYTINFNIPSSNDSQKVTLSKDEFQNYIIPEAVIESWKSVEIEKKEESNPAYNHTAMMKKDTKDGKPYVSTVFARKGNNEYLNAAQSEIKVFKNKDYDIIISADNLGGKSCTYYIEQDANYKISNSTGVFSSVDLYSKLDFDKACYAYVKTSDGVISELVPVNFIKQPANAFDEDVAFLKSSTFNLLGGDFLSITIPENVPLVGDAKISLNAFQLPAGFEFDGESLKISIGANIFEKGTELKANSPTKYKKVSSEWFSDWKNVCKDTMYSSDKKARDEYENAKKIFEKKWFGTAYKPNKSPNFSLEALGYIDATIVNGQTVVKEAYLSLGGNFSFKYTQQGAVWVIPAYVYAQAGAYIGGSATGSRVVADSELPFEWDFAIDINPNLRIGMGAGVKDVASAGVWGTGNLPILINIGKQFKMDLAGKFGIEAEFCVLKAEKTIFEGSMNLVNKYFKSSPKLKMMMSQQFGNAAATTQTSKTEVSVIDRDYLDNTSSWLGGATTWSLRDVAQDGLSLTALQTSVLNQASPQVVAFGDKMLMTWVEDDASRDTYNRMRLVYSIYENGIWSEPVAVCDDGKNDMNPVIATDGTNVYFAWQKIDEIITKDTATIDNLVAKTDIYVAKYDIAKNEIVATGNITQDSCYEYAQSISIVNGKPVCYFAMCSDNNISTSSANNILSYDFNSVPKLIKGSLNHILAVTGANVDGKENISYSMDVDGDTTTTDDVTVYTLVDNTTTAFNKGDNEVAYTNVFYGELDGKQTLFTSDMGNIYYVQDGETKTVFDSNRAITGNFNYVVKNGVPTLFWTEKEEKGNAVYSSSYENGVWTTPVRVSNTETQLASVDVVVYDDEFRGVCTSSDLEYNDVKEDYEFVQTNLCSFKINEVQDISVDDIYIDEENIKIGEAIEFDVYVTNNGTETVNNVSFEISDTLGFTSTVTKDINLASGEGAFVTLSYTAPTNYAKTTLTVTATCNEIVDNDSENDTATKEIGKSSLVLTESEVIEVNGQYLINAMITNESDVVADNVVINTLLNDSKDVVDTMEIESIGARETYSIEYVVSADDLTFDDENDTARVYITVDETNKNVTSNKICYVIAKPVELECGHISTEVVNDYDPTCTSTGSEGCVQCTLCGEIIEELGEIPATGHNYSSEVVEPTCTEDGYTTYTCDNCNDSYNNDYVDAYGHSFVDDVCEHCGETAYNYTFYIQKPSTTTIRNRDGIYLYAIIDGNAPKGSYIEWERSNTNFITGDEGDGVYLIMADDKGYTTFTAILYDADGNELARDSVKMYSKSGFFDKIGGFFRRLFGNITIHEN